MSDIDIDHLRGWIGQDRAVSDVITPRLAASLAAILDQDPDIGEGAPAPTAIHWCLAPDIAPMSGLGPDGHPARGGFLPPVPFPRRMWAGGELRHLDTLRVGDAVTRHSTIRDVQLKEGRTGRLCFVTVDHSYRTPRGVAIEERQDIVYRELEGSGGGARPAPAAPEAPAAEESRSIDATPVLLARYSAVTFNGHRIHYDNPYCRSEEGYPGLIVHGPLQATYMLDMARRRAGGTLPDVFSFRGVSPLFDGAAFTVNAAGTDLWIANAEGRKTMAAEVS
ncbi:FAS1-like dehydratase domain-containing protein [Acidimangrovimonas sediminis]|uniref:FAS1-like dehydratase domain-containing protein n=1 Tax=Acidimangrovimonas sediminis TaxID=2056283 RepID=UPI000C7F9521|nr:MaoC family dehydratase N-terminal domain-containing protein [Acidimangrovimonas sediminis]